MIIATLDGLSLDLLEAIPYTCINIIPVTRPNYGPVRNSGLLSATDMADYIQVIVTGTGQGSFEQTRDVLPNSLRWTVSDFAAKKEIILARMGWGGMPEHLVRNELDTGELIQLQIPEFPIRRSIFMLFVDVIMLLG